MFTHQKDPDEKSKKTSFWERLNEKASSGGSSLVDAIVKQAEKETGESHKNEHTKLSKLKSDNKEKESALTSLANAKTVLGFVVILIMGVGFYFFATLHESNYFHAKIGKENLTTELNRKTETIQQLRIDNRDTKKFSKLLQIENLANQILTVDLDDPILNYKRPEGQLVTSEDNSATLLKTLDSNGSTVYFSEAEVLSIEDTNKIRVEFINEALVEILKKAKELDAATKVGPETEKQLQALVKEITKIDLKEEAEDFPSAVLKSHFAAAQSSAKNILRSVKNENLKNLVTDIKKQAQMIDIVEASEETKNIVTALRTSLERLSTRQPSSFEIALNETQQLNINKIPEDEIYQKIIRIIGDPRSAVNESDLITATMIARNLGRINTINDLRGGRIAWSSVIDQTEKIVRLGANLERDTEDVSISSGRDIDPDGKLVNLLSYSGKSRKKEIEIRGNAIGEDAYDKINFALLADLIDAFEASKYFKNVSGFAFSKEENRQGKISSPLNFKFSLQDPAVTDSRDTVKIERSTEKKSESIDVEELKKINFSFKNSDLNEDDDAEFINVFEALNKVFNN